jgi:hypothetical protein
MTFFEDVSLQAFLRGWEEESDGNAEEESGVFSGELACIWDDRLVYLVSYLGLRKVAVNGSFC